MIILLGSRAARAWFADFREPKDWDAVASLPTIQAWARTNLAAIRDLLPQNDHKLRCRLHDGTRIEFEVIEPESSGALLAELATDFKPCEFPPLGAASGTTALAATPTLLWLTKRSHITWPIRWDKSIRDLHWLKDRARDPSVNETRYYIRRRGEHVVRWGARHTKLTVSNEEFFAQSARIGRVVEHDRLHELVAYETRPLFESFKTDLSKAMLDRHLFEQAPFDQRLRLVREEAMVIALERMIIPRLPATVDPALAYAHALRRICTNLTSGWFREFAIDHWPLLRHPDKDFVTPVLDFLANSTELPLNTSRD